MNIDSHTYVGLFLPLPYCSTSIFVPIVLSRSYTCLVSIISRKICHYSLLDVICLLILRHFFLPCDILVFWDNSHWKSDRICITCIYINYEKMNIWNLPIKKPNVYVFESFRACSFPNNFISSDFIKYFFLVNENFPTSGYYQDWGKLLMVLYIYPAHLSNFLTSVFFLKIFTCLFSALKVANL